MLVVTFDIIAGVGVLFGLSGINSSGPQVPAIWTAVTAGLLGSSLIRTNVKLPFGKRSQLRLVGVLRKLQESAERDLNEQCAIAESEWITNKVMPVLVNVELDDLIDWAKQYLEVQRLVLGDKIGTERRDAVEQIEKCRADASSLDARRRRVVQELLRARNRLVIRRMLRHARKTHGRILRRRRSARRMTADRLCRRLVLPAGFRKEILSGRIHISYENRVTTDKLWHLASQLADELGNHARVEMYKGWVVVSPPPKGGWREANERSVKWLVHELTVICSQKGLYLQRQGVVVNDETQDFTIAALVVSPGDAQQPQTGFNGKAVSLVSEVADADSADACRIHKRSVYADAQVPIYLLVDENEKQVFIYSDPRGSDYATCLTAHFGESLQLPSPFELTLDTERLDASTT